MRQEFVGRVAIVTGAGKGIGQATAIAFAKRGAHVVLSGQSKEPLMQTLALIEESGGKAARSSAMFRPKSRPTDGVDRAERIWPTRFRSEQRGRVPVDRQYRRLHLRDWQRVIGVNLTGTWLGMKYQIPAIAKNGRGGAIVNMTSVAALQVFEGYPVYSASKWGVVGVTKVAAREFASQGIRVNAIAPVRSRRRCSATS